MLKKRLLTIAMSLLAVALVAPANAAPNLIDEMLLETRVQIELFDRLGFDALDVDVEVEQNTVTLYGMVDTRETRELAPEIVKSVEGVQAVENDIKLDPDAKKSDALFERGADEAKREFSDTYLTSKVKWAILSELGRTAFNINVEVADGTVALTGEVKDHERKQLAVKLAQQVDGVDKVKDLLKTES